MKATISQNCFLSPTEIVGDVGGPNALPINNFLFSSATKKHSTELSDRVKWLRLVTVPEGRWTGTNQAAGLKQNLFSHLQTQSET